MRWKACLAPSFAAFFLAAAIPTYSQVAPAATQFQNPFSAGGGIAYFDLDHGTSQKMIGLTGWGDYRVPHMPRYLQGLGIEGEIRDVNYARPSTLHRMRQDTYLGGPTYTWPHYRNFHPYAKYLLGIGSIDFPPIGTYDHDTRVVFAPGIGFDYRFTPHLSVRVDYEYQFWHAIFGPHDLNPNGVTFGVLYNFGGSRSRY